MARRKLLNVKTHLEHINLLVECYEKHGDCPLFQEELAKVSFFNRQILRAHAEKNTRKDIAV
jgi:hypothetical protein